MALVITRKHGETVNIGDNIQATVYTDSANQVKLKIAAPDDMLILREELIEESDHYAATLDD